MSRVVGVLPFRRNALLSGQLPCVDGVSAAAAASHVSRVSRGAVRHHLRREVHNHACVDDVVTLKRLRGTEGVATSTVSLFLHGRDGALLHTLASTLARVVLRLPPVDVLGERVVVI